MRLIVNRNQCTQSLIPPDRSKFKYDRHPYVEFMHTQFCLNSEFLNQKMAFFCEIVA